MDYEKKYENSLDAAKKIYANMKECGNFSGMEDLEVIFPELAESEDEKIRKWIVVDLRSDLEEIYAKFSGDYDDRDADDIERQKYLENALAWLEKQSERDMKEALHTEYEKGRANAIAKTQKEQTQEYLEGVDRVQNYEELTKFEKSFDRIADTYAHRKNKDGYNKPWYTKERAAEMLYWAKEALGIFNEQKPYDNATIVVHHDFAPKSATEAAKEEKVDNQNCVKPANEVEPKFHEGDWITNGRYNKLIVGINSDYPLYIFKDGTSERILDIDKKYHLWTIQDAKDGDVLVSNDSSFIVLFKGLSYSEDDIDRFKSYCHHYREGIFSPIEDPSWSCNAFNPATKEQRDTLMKAMSDAGYTFDFEKKELKKIEHNSVWNEEDEKKVNNLCVFLDQMVSFVMLGNKDSTKFKDWLKSIKDRVQPQTKPFKEVYSQDQIDEVDRKIMETKRHYDARLYDAVLKAKDFPMNN